MNFIRPFHPSRCHPALPVMLACAMAWHLQATLAQSSADAPTSDHEAKPSRLISLTEIDAYIERHATTLTMATRAIDPFGEFQDPDAKPPPPPDLIPEIAVQPVQEVITPFEEIIRRISINTVIPGERKFLIGNREIRQGQELVVNYRNRPYTLQIVEVTGQGVVFRNAENGDTTTRDLNLLPAGMQAGGSAPAIPGLISAGDDVPLNLD